MSNDRFKRQGFAAGLVAMLLAASTGTLAQGSAEPGQVSGAQIQKWLDEGFSYAGVHRRSQCVIMNVAHASGRMLFMRCPNGWAEKIPGSALVKGDTYCTRFPIPNSTPGEDCVTWHSLGQGKYEQRKAGELDTTVILLPQGLSDAR